eukprot:CAMPEP_0184690980 /NCGR_PEP_ID=MMETSP0312-20130426/31554_1 /TAXON_ID=31354 /ORGANISM="Compsopogon coeruleus, Strain SAG 36.94" /LENGTH=337 /DNA_ID=CAMNT_0027148585 /DNA_START=178 /DNA_END=1191 /DNA_ORIENTATION=-
MAAGVAGDGAVFVPLAKRSASVAQTRTLTRDGSSELGNLNGGPLPSGGLGKRTFSFQTKISGRLGSFRNRESGEMTSLGGRRDTMRVNFPGFRGMNNEVEVEGDKIALKLREFNLKQTRSGDRVFDIVCVPHDGFRTEMAQMYKLLRQWKESEFEVGLPDLKKFFDWWDTFRTCLFDFFTIEERVLYSWIETKTALPKGMHVRERMVEKLDIIVWGQEVDKTRVKFEEAKDPKDCMSILLEAIQNFVGKLLYYMSKKEKILPEKFKEAVQEHRWVRYEKKLVEEVLKSKQGEMLFMIILNASDDGDQLKKNTLNFLQRKTQLVKWTQKYLVHQSLLR